MNRRELLQILSALSAVAIAPMAISKSGIVWWTPRKFRVEWLFINRYKEELVARARTVITDHDDTWMQMDWRKTHHEEDDDRLPYRGGSDVWLDMRAEVPLINGEAPNYIRVETHHRDSQEFEGWEWKA